jgi:hypothetical protein
LDRHLNVKTDDDKDDDDEWAATTTAFLKSRPYDHVLLNAIMVTETVTKMS